MSWLWYNQPDPSFESTDWSPKLYIADNPELVREVWSGNREVDVGAATLGLAVVALGLPIVGSNTGAALKAQLGSLNF